MVDTPATATAPVPGPTTDRGRTRIADRVVARVAERAALETDGVSAVRTGRPRGLGGSAGPRVAASIDGDLVVLRIALAVRYPAPLRAVTRDVRERVRRRITELTGCTARQIDIEIAAVVRPEEERRSR